MDIQLPDGRYIVVQGKAGPRLWRASNPALQPDVRHKLVEQLMHARRGVKEARGDVIATAAARSQVDQAKKDLGERGEVWWTDGQPDFNRRLITNTPYKSWWDCRPEQSLEDTL